ncbi:uncharacterized protein LOC128557063 [Mercenaria mercenaria]|uniref:uncharacterized protein LOC128557063 n=1 Tax=Mercenaria mercenaria TaxID=6596 RepID=UPI00234F58DF|nr:uncharacterized protein LOC128557063 [Mercenaria mercenaria]
MLKLIFAVVLVVLAGQGTDAADCCSSYTDVAGNYHESVLCADYCCVNFNVAYKDCCSDPNRQIPASRNENEACVKSWISEHIWVPIVGGIVSLVILIGICTCCCCCCGCCRSRQTPVIIHSNAPPSTTVAMASTNVAHNQFHAGYDQ